MITTLEETITRVKDVAEMNRREAEELRRISESKASLDKQYSVIIKRCQESAEEYGQVAAWLTELQERREADRWIPVSERLPEEKLNPNTHDFEGVQCTTIWKDVRIYKFGREIGYDTAHFWHGCVIMDKYIVAWKPLSKPYESEAESLDYQRAVEDTEYCERHEPTYNPDDGSM